MVVYFFQRNRLLVCSFIVQTPLSTFFLELSHIFQHKSGHMVLERVLIKDQMHNFKGTNVAK